MSEGSTPTCKRCGAELEFYDCSLCAGTGSTYPGELYEIDPSWYGRDETEPCNECAGDGGFWVCPSCPGAQPEAVQGPVTAPPPGSST